MKTAFNRRPRAKIHRHKGATLIEILVALLVLSLGILGMTALQIRALKGNHSSMQRSQAVMLSYYILDAMRVDRNNARALNYNTGEPVCSEDTIEGNTLADQNVKHWITSLKTNIGHASDDSTCGVITCDADGQCIIKVLWDDTRAGGLGEQTIETKALL